MRFVVQLGCGACLSSFRTVVEGQPCFGHAHIPVEGVVEQWGAAHRQPMFIVLAPAPEEA